MSTEIETVFDVDGATCAGCMFTIEHLGRKIPGVREIRVDAANHVIRVRHEPGAVVVAPVIAIVARLGYTAVARPVAPA